MINDFAATYQSVKFQQNYLLSIKRNLIDMKSIRKDAFLKKRVFEIPTKCFQKGYITAGKGYIIRCRVIAENDAF